MRDVEQTIIAALRDVHDPCCAERGLSVVDMGLVEDIRVDAEGATVDLVLTSGWCPFMVPLVDTIRSRIDELALGRPTDVRVVWDRAWTSARLSDTARQRLQFLPPPNQVGRDGPAVWAAGVPPEAPALADPEVTR